jgi:DNA-directed RNA polymerase II subunit RPB11
MSNKPAAWELFILADGQSKVTMAMDTKIPNAATFTIQKEDHTLANLLRMWGWPVLPGHRLMKNNRQLLKNPKVLFAGYKLPHPLEPHFLLKIQTTPDTHPKDVLQQEIQKLIASVEDISGKFKVLLFVSV